MVVAAPLQPATLDEVWKLAQSAGESGFLGTKSPDQAFMVMLAGRDLGFSYTQSLRAFHIIKGKPTISADGAVAVCLSRKDLCEYFRCIQKSPTSATWETKRVGHEPVRETFTIQDAEAAGLLSNEMYRKYPARMLSARCKMFLARDTYPELLMGLLGDEEAIGIEDRPNLKARVTRALEAAQAVSRENVPSKAWSEPGPTAAERKLDEALDAIIVDEDGVVLDNEAIKARGTYANDGTEVLILGGRIRDAKTLEELDAIAKDIPKMKLSELDTGAIRSAWKLRRETIKGGA